MSAVLGGIFPPLATIFDSTGNVDTGAISANVARLMTTPLSGVLALGSNGEAGLLDDEEGDSVVEAARAAVPADRVVLVGVGRESTVASIAAARRAADLGADAVLVRPPSYYKAHVSNDALVAHFRHIADVSPVPIVLYNLPGPTGVILTPAMVASMAEHQNVLGLKETSPDLERLGISAGLRAGKFPVMSGWAPVLYPAMMAGAAGGILAVANVLPEQCVALYTHVKAGRYVEALALQRRITKIAMHVSSVHGIAGLKAAMEMLGYSGGPVRAPLTAAGDKARAEIAAALKDAQEK
ncbi:MAG TPA: dihydrodipicolinate synthase family protein [Vicinamibacterales bacterium]|nr:dihydrodipicolinate synthase family protein [Vicinamibacterales bacterium]